MGSTEAVSVVIADDQPVYRQGLAAILGRRPDIKLLGEAANGRDAVKITTQLRPDVLLLDLDMPGLDGLGVLKAIDRVATDTRMVMLSAAFDSTIVYAALGAGAAVSSPRTRRERRSATGSARPPVGRPCSAPRSSPPSRTRCAAAPSRSPRR